MAPLFTSQVTRLIRHSHSNIQGYSKSRAAEIRERFFLDLSDEAEIIGKVTEASKGSFGSTRISFKCILGLLTLPVRDVLVRQGCA
jgi:hypothetical protein